MKKQHPQKRVGHKPPTRKTHGNLCSSVNQACADFFKRRGLPPTGEDLPQSKRHLKFGYHSI